MQEDKHVYNINKHASKYCGIYALFKHNSDKNKDT
jgi:hypothetical protein